MSKPIRMVLAGATGMVGGAVVARAAARRDLALTALARREPGARGAAAWVVGEPVRWHDAIAAIEPEVLGIALGTTWRAAGRSEAAFRAVDQHLVMACAEAASLAGTRQCILVSSIGADAASRSFYLRVKGEVEDALARLNFLRLDILRPGLLRGARGGERRLGERLAMRASPLTDRLLHGPLRRYRSIPAATVAAAILGLAGQAAPGRFVHEHDAIRRAAG